MKKIQEMLISSFFICVKIQVWEKFQDANKVDWIQQAKTFHVSTFIAEANFFGPKKRKNLLL